MENMGKVAIDTRVYAVDQNLTFKLFEDHLCINSYVYLLAHCLRSPIFSADRILSAGADKRLRQRNTMMYSEPKDW